jgi:hypothetical protein
MGSIVNNIREGLYPHFNNEKFIVNDNENTEHYISPGLAGIGGGFFTIYNNNGERAKKYKNVKYFNAGEYVDKLFDKF